MPSLKGMNVRQANARSGLRPSPVSQDCPEMLRRISEESGRREHRGCPKDKNNEDGPILIPWQLPQARPKGRRGSPECRCRREGFVLTWQGTSFFAVLSH